MGVPAGLNILRGKADGFSILDACAARRMPPICVLLEVAVESPITAKRPMTIRIRPPVSPADTPDHSREPGLDQVGQNIETILAFYKREEQEMSVSQRVLETASDLAGATTLSWQHFAFGRVLGPR